MDLVRLDGYTDDEKVFIARRYLLPRQLERAGLRDDETQIDDEVVSAVIRSYTREAGVRGLERELGRLVRKVTAKVATGTATPVLIAPDQLHDWLGRPKIVDDIPSRTNTPGVATGLAVTGVGGDVLSIETTAFPTGPGSSEPTLRKVSFALAPGEALGVVGSSGSGKSTLARVAVGAWRPYSGSVRLDGADIESYGRHELGPFLGYLPQEVELFEGTVAENIARFGELDAVSVVEAARRTGVHEMILGLPDGYETQLGPQGCVLSGGQRQRIGLARALYGSPVLVVLDEPNANLDSAGESALIDAVQTLKSLGSTVILVSHRPNVLSDVDHLLLLKAGAPALMKSRNDLKLEVSSARKAPLRWAETR
jgi:ABC-type protease/lipase transport system fused ATPase/permease subunit